MASEHAVQVLTAFGPRIPLRGGQDNEVTMTPNQQKIVDFITAKNKTNFYFKDFLDIFPEKGPREVKKILTSMVQCEVMEFWSSGSTTMYGLKGAGKQSQAEGEG